MMSAKQSPLLLALALALAGCRTDAPTAMATVETLPGGGIHVVNHDPIEWPGFDGWHLVEERVITSAPDGAGLLASPRNVVAAPNGDILVLDRNPARILHYDADGNLLGTLGRQGAGPGEFADYGDLAIAGDTVIINDRGNSRIVLLGVDGSALGSFRAGQGPLVGPASRDGHVSVFAYLAQRPSSTADNYAGSGFRRWSLDGRLTDSLFYPPEQRPQLWTLVDATHDLGAVIPFSAMRVYALDPEGRLLWGDQDRYRIIVSRTGADTALMIDAQAPVVPIADSLRQAALSDMVASAEWLTPIAHLEDIPTAFPSWTDLRVDGAGNIWVLRPAAGSDSGIFDVFAPDGKLRGRLPAPFGTLDYSFWTTDRVYRIGTGPADEPQIEVWRIERGPEPTTPVTD